MTFAPAMFGLSAARQPAVAGLEDDFALGVNSCVANATKEQKQRWQPDRVVRRRGACRAKVRS